MLNEMPSLTDDCIEVNVYSIRELVEFWKINKRGGEIEIEIYFYLYVPIKRQPQNVWKARILLFHCERYLSKSQNQNKRCSDY